MPPPPVPDALPINETCSEKPMNHLSPMDETVSSINSSSDVTTDLKGKSSNSKPFNSTLMSKQLNTSAGHQPSKPKIISGSLTSTPSKLKAHK